MPRSLGVTSVRILAAIRKGRAYGLDIIQETGLPSGTVDPTLARMKRNGLVTAVWEDPEIGEEEGRPRRRYYTLTPEGEGALAEGTQRVFGLAAELAEG